MADEEDAEDSEIGPDPFDVAVERWIASLSPEHKDVVLRDVAWDVLGDFSDDGRFVLLPDRVPAPCDVQNLTYFLRAELRPFAAAAAPGGLWLGRQYPAEDQTDATAD